MRPNLASQPWLRAPQEIIGDCLRWYMALYWTRGLDRVGKLKHKASDIDPASLLSVQARSEVKFRYTRMQSNLHSFWVTSQTMQTLLRCLS